jgi:hypothetical protein
LSTAEKNKSHDSLEKRFKLFIDFLKSNNQKILIFIFFVFLSSIFWLIRSLGEQYEATVNYPVRYTDYPEGKQLVGEVPEELTLRVNASGFNILKSKLNLNLVPLKFDVASFSLNSKGRDTFFVVTQSVKDILSNELKEVTIIDIYPDTLYFRFTEIGVRKVEVRPVLNMNDKFFDVQYMQNGDIIVDPDSIIVSGPANLLDSVSFVNTTPVSLVGLNDTAKFTADLEKISNLTFSQNRVEVIIPVDRFTEVEELMPVTSVHVPPGEQLVPIPGQVRVIYKVSLSNYNKVANSKSFLLFIDYNDIINTGRTTVPVFLSDTPSFINDIRLNPAVIEFLIRKND